MHVVSKLFLLLTFVALICVEDIVIYVFPMLQQTGFYIFISVNRYFDLEQDSAYLRNTVICFIRSLCRHTGLIRTA